MSDLTPPPPLHLDSCTDGSSQDLEKMRQALQDDPQALERVQYFSRSSLLYLLGRSCEVPPLYDACYKGHLNCVNFLVTAGANINIHIENYDTLTAIDLVYLNSQTDANLKKEIVEYLFANGALSNIVTKTGHISPSHTLILCMENGHAYNKIAQLLLENKSATEKFQVLEDGKIDYLIYSNPIQSAIHEGNTNGYKLLLLHGAINRLFYVLNNNGNICIEYGIPQYIINGVSKNYDPCCLSTYHVLETLQVYKEFGGNLWVKDKWGGEVWGRPTKLYKRMNALQYLRHKPKLMTALPGLDVELEKMMKEPLSLQCITRLVLRNCMGRDYWQTSQQLPLPQDLKKFLLFGVEPRD